MKKITLFLMSLMMSLGSFAQAGEAVELPDGVVSEQWYVEGTFVQWNNTYQQWMDYDIADTDFTFEVAIDGNDVYISGLDYFEPNTWVKGTINGNTIVFPSGQFMAEAVENGVTYYDYINGLSLQTYEAIENFTMTYDADAQTMTLDEGFAIGVASEPNSNSIYGYYENLVFSKNAPAPDEVVTPPAGVDIEEYIYEGNTIDFDQSGNQSTEPFSTTANVAIDGNDIYMQGLFKDYMPEAWVKGTRNGSIVTFPSGQYIGIFSYQGTDYSLYLLGVEPESTSIKDLTMVYNEEDNEFVANELIMSSVYKNRISYLEIQGNAVLYKDASGVKEVSADNAEAIYFDTTGRRVDANTKGLLIKQTRQSNGTVKTVKVVR